MSRCPNSSRLFKIIIIGTFPQTSEVKKMIALLDNLKTLTEGRKKMVFKILEELNNVYGYNGNRVDSKDIFKYYLDVAPEGLWTKVEVLHKEEK
jgi:hypothetical protein